MSGDTAVLLRAIRAARHGGCCSREYDRDRDAVQAAVRVGDDERLAQIAAGYGLRFDSDASQQLPLTTYGTVIAGNAPQDYSGETS